MTLLVRDEADVLEDHLEYHFSQGVDFVVVTDNLSEDRTPDILDHYAQQGRLTWRRETDDDYRQSAWVTRMAREAATVHGADWVINSDADEFWWPTNGSLRSFLAQLPDATGGVKVHRYNFLPVAEEDGKAFYQAMTVREVVSRKQNGQRILPKVAHRAHPDIVVAQGNHDVTAVGLGRVVAAEGLQILHFPMRSYQQFENKIVKGGQAYTRNPDGAQHGGDWQNLYELYRAGGLRRHYDEKIPLPEAVSQGIREGHYVVDTRLRDHLAALDRDRHATAERR